MHLNAQFWLCMNKHLKLKSFVQVKKCILFIKLMSSMWAGPNQFHELFTEKTQLTKGMVKFEFEF